MENKLNISNFLLSDLNRLDLKFGKCLYLEQYEKVEPLKNFLNIPFCHKTSCELERIYNHKSTSEIKDLEFKFQELILNKNISVKFASVGIIIDKNNNVLMTRRNANLYTFPRAWVFPGGKIDEGESYIDALIREVFEETGIKIIKKQEDFFYNNEKVEITPILLYESCYTPPNCDLVTSQILVTYFKIEIGEIKENINLNIQVDEIDAYAWIHFDLLKNILYSTNQPSSEYEFEGFVYIQSDFSFGKMKFSRKNFNNKETNEIIPYGHYLALKYLL